MTPLRPDPSTFPDSPYAAELQKHGSARRFAPELEADYLRSQLLNDRALIRMACVLAALVTSFRATEQLLGGFAGSLVPAWLAVSAFAVSASVALTWLAWSRAFERWYPPVARIIVPVRNVVAAVPIAAMAARGHLELLMVLPAMVLGPFFFLGLRLRVALVSVVLTVTSFAAAAAFFELALPVVLRACVFLSLMAITCAMAVRQLEKRSRASFLESRLIAEFAQHDALTGTKNRRVFDEHLARLWQQAIEDRRTLAIVLIDVDHFKAYNDRYGHQAGDQALRQVAQTLQTLICRPLDVLARYGGEEFAAILYDIDANEARDVADRMRQAVGALAMEHRGSRISATITISAGVAVIEPTQERKPRGALQLADEALYDAKVRGRNRIEIREQAEYSTLVTGVFSKSTFRRSTTPR